MSKVGIMFLALMAVLLMPQAACGQSIKDLLNSATVKNAVTAVTGGKALSVANVQGTWMYDNPAVQLEGDNALKNIAGSVATTELEKKLKEYCAKAGIVEGVFNYTFNTDSTFTSALKKGSLNGTYSIDAEAKTITFHYSLGKAKKLTVTSLTAHVVLSGDELTLLFNADKLLKFLSTLSSVSNNSTLQTISKLASQYEGMMLGFHLKK